MNDAALVTVLNGVAQLSEPDARSLLRDALVFSHSAKQISAGRLLHYDVNTSRRLDRLLIYCTHNNTSLRTQYWAYIGPTGWIE